MESVKESDTPSGLFGGEVFVSQNAHPSKTAQAIGGMNESDVAKIRCGAFDRRSCTRGC
jgi:hypothetical protein